MKKIPIFSLLLLAAVCLPALAATTKLTTLNSFAVNNWGDRPIGAVVVGADGNYYGTTQHGGPADAGTVFKLTPSGSLTTLGVFNGTNGQAPQAALIAAADGTLYGTTYRGGTSGKGTIFKYTTKGALLSVLSFNGTNGTGPNAALLLGPDGYFYCTTYSGGASDLGTIFRVSAGGSIKTLLSFSGTNGSHPNAALVLGTDGLLYGSTNSGGAGNKGTLFKITTKGVFTSILSFNGDNGAAPNAALVSTASGYLYGTTSSGGYSFANNGTIFKLSPTGVLTTLHIFDDGDNSDGYTPGALLRAHDGAFYGCTAGGGEVPYGTLFKITATGAFQQVKNFDYQNSSPGALTLISNGNAFVGTTYQGGDFFAGSAFTMALTGARQDICNFGGKSPSSVDKIVLGGDGNYYGIAVETTAPPEIEAYGANNWYKVEARLYRLSPAGGLTYLYSFLHTYETGRFSHREDITKPGRPVASPDGSIYFTLVTGINDFSPEHSSDFLDYNTDVMRLDAAGHASVLWSFDGQQQDYYYIVVLEAAPDGSLYGFNPYNGSIFRGLPTDAAPTYIYGDGDWYEPNSTPVITFGGEGNYYFATNGGLTSSYDSWHLFKITPAGVATDLKTLTPTTVQALALDAAGNLDGSDDNKLFQLTPSRTFRNLPVTIANSGPLVTAADGNVYGASSNSGSAGKGGIFRITTTGKVQTAVNFNGTTSGANPCAGLIPIPGGGYFGLTSAGGSAGAGTLFKVTVTP